MKLTTQQILDVTVGAVHTVEKEDGIHFYKCTPKQIAAWYNQSQTLGESPKPPPVFVWTFTPTPAP